MEGHDRYDFGSIPHRVHLQVQPVNLLPPTPRMLLFVIKDLSDILEHNTCSATGTGPRARWGGIGVDNITGSRHLMSPNLLKSLLESTIIVHCASNGTNKMCFFFFSFKKNDKKTKQKTLTTWQQRTEMPFNGQVQIRHVLNKTIIYIYIYINVRL